MNVLGESARTASRQAGMPVPPGSSPAPDILRVAHPPNEPYLVDSEARCLPAPMKTLPLLLLLIAGGLTGCETTSAKAPRHVRARVTFYNPHEDKYGSKIAIGGRAHEGTTMAAPSCMPFGLQVNVPQLRGHVGTGNFVIQDRGSALEKAYRRGQLRLDVYVSTRAKLAQCRRGLPEYMEATIQ
jgi:hypothetical protein